MESYLTDFIWIGGYLLWAWGLYSINRKLWEPYPWMSWIPLLQIYSLIKAAGKNTIWILWYILSSIGSLVWFLIFIFALHWISYSHSTWVWIILFIWLLLILLNLVVKIYILHWISKRINRWVWTTIGLLMVPFIMFPIIGYKLQNWTLDKKTSLKLDSEEL